MNLVDSTSSLSGPRPSGPRHAGDSWIDLEEAARRAGYSGAGTIRRFHLQRFIEAGMAKLEKPAPPSKGKARWLVREDADPKFARVKFPEQISAAADLRKLTDKQRATVQDRLRLIRKWEAERAAGLTLKLSETKITASFLDRLLIDEGKTISRATLFNWLAGYRRSGLAGLIDARWINQQPAGSGEQADAFLDEVKRLYLSLRRPKLTVCHEMACLKAQEQGWPIRSYKTAQRFIDAIPRAVLLKHRFGEEAFTNDAEPFLEKDYSTLSSNEIWCGDHHQFDVLVAISERTSAASGEVTTRYIRPWLSAWMDERSRKIVGWTIIAHDPNSDTILAALHHGIGLHGVPEFARMDNGKDYDCYAFHGETKKQRRRRIRLGVDERTMGIFVQLAIGTKHVQPYHGQSKPIERFFNTLEDRFGRTWDTYCGNKPENRPEDFQEKLDAGKAPALEDFVAAFELWLANDYHARAHLGDAMDGKCPQLVWTENLSTKRTASADLLELLLLKPSKPVRVQQNGVTWNGLRFGQFDPALHQMIGKWVVLRTNPRDLSQVSVWTTDGRFVCIAPANSKVPVNADAQTLREALDQKRQMRKTMKEYAQVRPRLHEDLPDLMIRAAARKNRHSQTDNPELPPPSLKPVQTPLAEGAKQYQAAVERRDLRIAVGAEGMSLGSATLGSYQRSESNSDDQGELGDVTDYLKYRPAGSPMEDSHE